ncbi:sugar ABC transporter permease [Microbacterium oxydans]|uniref:carbohydrate ABC transporter permease n=1 Tax=Microbacterium TaxID=33882 RepID=UPI000B83CEAC|nr:MULTISPECIES: sugar ABC transporter permease [Microbacterium]NJI59464.1 sugar ABC transporter permease [Microbacterium sp. B19(2022)]
MPPETMTVSPVPSAPDPGPARPRVAASPRKVRRDFLPYALIAPGALLVVGFTVIALGFTLISSFTDWDVGRLNTTFIGIDNYLRAFRDPEMVASLWRSGIFVLSVVALSTAAGFLLAVALNRRFPGRGAVRALVVLPWVISEMASGVFWALILKNDGILSAFGLEQSPLESPAGAMTALILVESWRSIGFVTVMVLAGLQSIDPGLYEAAKIDGATAGRITWSITLPLVSPTVLIAAILLMIGNFNLVTMIIALTAGGPITATTTTALYMYNQSFTYFHLGYGAAIAMIMSVFNVIAMFAFILLQRGRGARS